MYIPALDLTDCQALGKPIFGVILLACVVGGTELLIGAFKIDWE